jgi:MEMO1 family protein
MKNIVRKAKVAGQFYDKNTEVLHSFINKVKSDISVTPEKNVRAVILPHAGYTFSGKTAIKTLMTAKNNSYKNIFIIAPSHYISFEEIALSTFNEYETPFGNIPVNTKIVNALAKCDISIKNEPHIHEHSLEVQLPLIKDIFPKTPIVPIVCGFTDNSQIINIVDKLYPYWNNENLWIISSDFTHYGKSFGYTPFINNIEENLRKLDKNAIKEILDLNPTSFYNYIKKTETTICGKTAILIMLYLAKKSIIKHKLRTKLIEYTTSGALTGDYSHCVSYAGIAVYE